MGTHGNALVAHTHNVVANTYATRLKHPPLAATGPGCVAGGVKYA